MVEKKQPMRMCVACRKMHEKRSLIRVVKTPSGEIFIDERGKVSGRGAYICKDKACFEKAVKARAIERALSVTLDIETKAALLKVITDE
ncbi:MAG: YlxR family protein [Clostridia bacterium]